MICVIRHCNIYCDSYRHILLKHNFFAQHMFVHNFHCIAERNVTGICNSSWLFGPIFWINDNLKYKPYIYTVIYIHCFTCMCVFSQLVGFYIIKVVLFFFLQMCRKLCSNQKAPKTNICRDKNKTLFKSQV
jgi:hypothetical protein